MRFKVQGWLQVTFNINRVVEAEDEEQAKRMIVDEAENASINYETATVHNADLATMAISKGKNTIWN